ncbi:nucleotide sugar dehydrogenase [Amycolatopsis sp. cg5]|uniref:nucleotide sugar dehydrogenase n=1 Tax=Amycolatopsis sp. cg5 TaxID=3238802 RepID=UPI0035259596
MVGVGYVGLPLAVAAHAAGLSVAGYDISATVVRRLNSGDPGGPDVPGQRLRQMLDDGFTVTTDPAVLASADTIVICVPTGLSQDGTPDLGPVRSAAAAVAGQLRPGTLVVLESTSFPGTTDEVVRPILERGGLVAGEDFALGYSPERVDPGNRRFGVRNTPKIVSGHTSLCAKYCATFYSRLVDSVVVAKGTREAELAKLLENTYRYVNIALVNEITRYCNRVGVDVWDVLHCAATKPFGFEAFAPGAGVGGHCIPVDPRYLLHSADRAGFDLTVVRAAREVDAAMPGYVVERVVHLLDQAGVAVADAEVLLLGVTYKAGVPDMRESRAVPVAAELSARGTRVTYHDPLIGVAAELAAFACPAGDLGTAVRRADVTVLMVGHRSYRVSGLTGSARRLLDITGSVPGEEVERL